MVKRAKNITDKDIHIHNGTVVIASDVHIPFQDDKAVRAFCSYCEEKKPEYIILNGDILDFFRLSRFTKGEGRNPMEEINLCRKLLETLRELCPQSKIYYIIGNHENRLEKYILNNAPEIACVVEDIFTILGTSEFNIEGCASLRVNKTLLFKHGTFVGAKSGLSAIKELEKAYMSGCSGHTHRLCKFITRKSGKKFFWIEIGCLCTMNPDYLINPDWQQGFAHIEIRNGEVFNAKVIEIENGRVLQ